MSDSNLKLVRYLFVIHHLINESKVNFGKTRRGVETIRVQFIENYICVASALLRLTGALFRLPGLLLI